MGKLSEMPQEERPRERLLRDGVEALSEADLLAVVLGTGRGSGEDALMLATRVLDTVGGLRALAGLGPAEMQQIAGIGPVRAARIVAALALTPRALAPEASRSESTAPTAAPPPVPVDPLAECVARLRGQVAVGARAILACRPDGCHEPMTLGLGEGLDPTMRPGALLARLLTVGLGPWWVAILRPGGPPTSRERDAAARLAAAAMLLGLNLERVLLIAGQRYWALESAE